MDLTQKVNPCGIAAKFIFNGIMQIKLDSFLLYDASDNSSLALNSTGIAFDVDLQYKYSRTKDSQFKQWLDFDDGITYY